MKFKPNKLSLNFVIASALLAASLPALAVTGDTEQPIHIESDTQSLDMQGNVVTFTGNVVMTQGTIKINADKVVVTRPGGEQGKEIIDGYGNPATFYQMQDNGKPVKGHASHMHYEVFLRYILPVLFSVYLYLIYVFFLNDFVAQLVALHDFDKI